MSLAKDIDRKILRNQKQVFNNNLTTDDIRGYNTKNQRDIYQYYKNPYLNNPKLLNKFNEFTKQIQRDKEMTLDYFKKNYYIDYDNLQEKFSLQHLTEQQKRKIQQEEDLLKQIPQISLNEKGNVQDEQLINNFEIQKQINKDKNINNNGICNEDEDDEENEVLSSDSEEQLDDIQKKQKDYEQEQLNIIEKKIQLLENCKDQKDLEKQQKLQEERKNLKYKRTQLYKNITEFEPSNLDEEQEKLFANNEFVDNTIKISKKQQENQESSSSCDDFFRNSDDEDEDEDEEDRLIVKYRKENKSQKEKENQMLDVERGKGYKS